MTYKDLLKITIYFIAIKLFIDSISRLPEKLYTSFLAGAWLVNVISFIFLNLFIVIILLKAGNYFVDKMISKKENYLTISKESTIEISLNICAYYIILTETFSMITHIFSLVRIDFTILEILISIIISILLLKFSKKISKKISKI